MSASIASPAPAGPARLGLRAILVGAVLVLALLPVLNLLTAEHALHV